MMEKSQVHILWDAAHIWGLMAWRAVRAYGVPCQLLQSKEIAQQGVLGKPQGILLVPGGSARLKARALGARGRDAIRRWVGAGGFYLGFCGGAGLALTPKHPGDGLSLCPWSRANYSQRVYHLLSGHVRADVGAASQLLLPVWWPGRFAAAPESDVRVLASYLAPAADLWLADLPLASLPEQVAADSEMKLDFPDGQPLCVRGVHAQGEYLLSYSHLETPASSGANAWLAAILAEKCHVRHASVPQWDTGTEPDRLHDSPLARLMADGFASARRLLSLGVELRLFFRRMPWLWGWCPGVPGMAFNNLMAAFATALELAPSARALAAWEQKRGHFEKMLQLFFPAAEEFLWLLRLAATMSDTRAHWGGQTKAHALALRLFGHPMLGGGSCRRILLALEELIYLSQENAPACV